MKGAIVTVTVPGLEAAVTALVRDYAPRAGEIVLRRARGKLGVYQPGWAKLKPSTLRRKRRGVKLKGRRLPFERWAGLATSGVMAHTPLIDTGKMGSRMKSYARASTAYVTADFPMNVHEQDAEVGDFSVPSNGLPARPVMWPAVEESIPPIVQELEALIGSRL